IDKVTSTDFINCVKELVDSSTKAIGENADFFFIRELRDNFGYENEPLLKDLLLNLNTKQFEYIINRKDEIRREKEFFQIKNTEVVKPVITALIYLLNKEISESEAVKTIIDLKRKYEENYDVLKDISINNKADDDGGNYNISIAEELNTVLPGKIAEALEKLIEEIGKSREEDFNQTFIADFKIVAGELVIEKMKRIGINFNRINHAIRYQNRWITKKVLQALLDVISSKTSKSSAITIIGETVALLQGIHPILNYVKINTSNDEDSETFIVLSEMNSIESYKLGTAFRDVITIIQENHKNIPLMKDFKKQLGDEYLAEIENLGVNLHFLELRYR
ncbi:MAG: hypothetical protein KAI20_05045, partial [Thermoplasmatales archaeon]|nr:hypothetical protein [Thermoplasmatales archaeon]